MATCTDNVTSPKHTAGCCGTLSGHLLAAIDHLKGLVCFHYAFSVFLGLSFSFSSKRLFLTADQPFSSPSSIPSAPSCTDKFVFRPLSWLSKCQLQIFRLSICQARVNTSVPVFPVHPHASLAVISFLVSKLCTLKALILGIRI